MIKLVCIIEVPDAHTELEAEKRLDAFREAVGPTMNYGLVIYCATAADIADMRVYLTKKEG